jgi:WD40 repeat protein
LALSPDGKLEVVSTVSASGRSLTIAFLLREVNGGKIVREWTADPKLIGTMDAFWFRGGGFQPRAGAFSPDGRLFAAVVSGLVDAEFPARGGDDLCPTGTVFLWDVESGECLRTLAGDTGGKDHLAFVGDGLLLATWGIGFPAARGTVAIHPARNDQAESLALWDPRTGQRVAYAIANPKQPDDLLGATFERGTSRLVFAFKDGSEERWDLRDASPRKKFGDSPTEEEIAALGEELAGDSPPDVFWAMGWLISRPEGSLAMLKHRLRVARAFDPDGFARAVAALDYQEASAQPQACAERLENRNGPTLADRPVVLPGDVYFKTRKRINPCAFKPKMSKFRKKRPQ